MYFFSDGEMCTFEVFLQRMAAIQKHTTRVVKLQRKKGEIYQDCDVYIGREVKRGGWNLKASCWGNPYCLGKNGMTTIQDVLTAYEAHVRASPHLMSKLPTLKGKRLGCWCYPKPCHGNVLLKLIKELQ